jgi:dTMP kinase
MSSRGRYIVIEGSDGTGKSLQAIRLTDHLERLGIPVLRVHNDETGNMEPIQEPGGTPKADLLRRKIKDKTIARTPWQNVKWFTEARQSIWREAIEPALAAGIWVVTARSWISTMAYQGYGEGESLDKIRDYTRETDGEAYMQPDAVYILALQDEAERRNRLNNADRSQATNLDAFESKPQAFQDSMQSGYIAFANDNSVERIDASQSRDEVEAAIWEKIEPLLNK